MAAARTGIINFDSDKYASEMNDPVMISPLSATLHRLTYRIGSPYVNQNGCV